MVKRDFHRQPIGVIASYGWLSSIDQRFSSPEYSRFCYPYWEDLSTLAFSFKRADESWVPVVRAFVSPSYAQKLGPNYRDVLCQRRELLDSMSERFKTLHKATVTELLQASHLPLDALPVLLGEVTVVALAGDDYSSSGDYDFHDSDPESSIADAATSSSPSRPTKRS